MSPPPPSSSSLPSLFSASGSSTLRLAIILIVLRDLCTHRVVHFAYTQPIPRPLRYRHFPGYSCCSELFRPELAPPSPPAPTFSSATSLPLLPTSLPAPHVPAPLVPAEQRRQLLVLGRTANATTTSRPAALRAPPLMAKLGRVAKRSPLSRSRPKGFAAAILAVAPVATATACCATPQPRKRMSIELQDSPFDINERRPAKRSRKSLIILESLRRSQSPMVLGLLFDATFLPALLARLDAAAAAAAATAIATKNAAAAAAARGAAAPSPAMALQGQTTPSLLAVAVRAGSETMVSFLREVFDAHCEALGRHDHVGDKAARSRMSREALGHIKNLTLWLPQFCRVMSSIYEDAQMTASPQQMAVHAADGALVINAVIETAAEVVSKGRVQAVVETMSTSAALIAQNLGVRAVKNVCSAVVHRQARPGPAPAPHAVAITQLGVLQGLCGLDENGAAQTGGEPSFHPAWTGFVTALSHVLDGQQVTTATGAAAPAVSDQQHGMPAEALLRSAEVQTAWLAVAALLSPDHRQTMRLFAWTGKEYARLWCRYRQQTVIIMEKIAGVPSSLR